jgi:PmbA protein
LETNLTEDDLSHLSQQLLADAVKAGAEAADVIAVHGTYRSIEVRAGELEHAEHSEGVDLGLRVIIGKRQACVSVSDRSKSSLERMCVRAVAMAAEAPEDPTVGLAEPELLAAERDADALDLFDPSEPPSPEDLSDWAKEAEAAALAVKGISQSESGNAAWSQSRIFLATTNGFEGGYGRTRGDISCSAIAGEGLNMERDYDYESRIFRSDLPDPAEIGKKAGERAVANQGASQPPTGAFPVLYDERVSGSLVAHLVAAVNGSSVARGSSWLKDALGEQVLPETMTLEEDPHRPRVGGSKPFDGEGLPTRARNIIDKGELTGWTLDLASARKLGLESTGNASRGTSSPPSPSIGNLALTQGNQSREDLMRDMGTGLLVTSLIGASINPTTGDYSRGASGFWVENGEITRPVNECTIAGNLRDMLKTLRPANDANLHKSRVIPSLLVEGLTIAGA